MCSDESDWTCLQPGFPIRKSTDHSLVIDSPWLIADSYVLLRFLVPRHPPCALKNLIRKDKDARVHCVVLNIRAALHQAQRLPSTPERDAGGSPTVKVLTGYRPERTSLRPSPQDPTTCQAPTRSPPRSNPVEKTRCTCVQCTRRRQIIDVPPLSTCCPTFGDRPGSGRSRASAP